MSEISREALPNFVGRSFRDSGVQRLASEFPFDAIEDDPPGRRYVISQSCGVDLVLENDVVTDVQVYVQATRRHAAFRGLLPYDIKRDMTQADVHRTLGIPAKYTEVSSTYFMESPPLRLHVEYDARGTVRYLSLAPIAQWSQG